MTPKIQANVQYRLRHLLTLLLWPLGIYFILVPVIFTVLIQAGNVSADQGSLVYRLGALVVHQFIVSAKFQEDFDTFLTFSNTRQGIFTSLAIVAVIKSALISVLVVLEKVIIDFLNTRLGFENITDPFHAFAPYAVDNIFTLFVFFLALCIGFSFLGMLLGSLSYRFGRLFDLIVWSVVSILSLIYLPLAIWSLIQEGRLTAVLTSIGEVLGSFNVWVSSGLLLLSAMLLGALTFLNMRRLPQN